jgi:hypothetical protein
MKLTVNQVVALRAAARPTDVTSYSFWLRAGAYGGRVDGRVSAGIRNTFGSLSRLGLVTYESGWAATELGKETLAKIEGGE